jgi:hypothetical protein
LQGQRNTAVRLGLWQGFRAPRRWSSAEGRIIENQFQSLTIKLASKTKLPLVRRDDRQNNEKTSYAIDIVACTGGTRPTKPLVIGKHQFGVRRENKKRFRDLEF